MGHVPVPWYIGGDAITPDKIARLVSFISAGGREGVLNALDCRVLAQTTPGPSIRVMPGAYAINSRTAPNENYTGMVDVADNVATTATGSSGGRSDLVVILVKNSNNAAEGWDAPADPANGPYISTEIITGVPANTTSWAQLGILGSAIALARIDFPPSTATVTQAMIKDLRGGNQTSGTPATTGTGGPAGGVQDPVITAPVASAPTPSTASFVSSINCTSGSNLSPPATGSGTRYSNWGTWPSEAQYTVPIPPTATEAALYFTINPALSANTWGELRMNFNNGALISQATSFDVNFPLESNSGVQCKYSNGGGQRDFYVIGGTVSIPAAMRGKNISVKVEGRTIDDTTYIARGVSTANRGTVAYCSIAFKQGATTS